MVFSEGWEDGKTLAYLHILNLACICMHMVGRLLGSPFVLPKSTTSLLFF